MLGFEPLSVLHICFALLEESFDKKERASFPRGVLDKGSRNWWRMRFYSFTLLVDKHARTFNSPLVESRILILEPNGMIGPGEQMSAYIRSTFFCI